jgi:hypothetical protein
VRVELVLANTGQKGICQIFLALRIARAHPILARPTFKEKTMSEPSPSPLCLFHANCNDGFCAAWVLRRTLPHAEFIPVNHGQEPPWEKITSRLVFLLDFSYKREVMVRMNDLAQRLVVLDHHKSAQEELADLPTLDKATVVFATTQSGAMLTWGYFEGGREPPWLVSYTMDRDLWLFKLPFSKEVNASLSSYPRTFEQWDEFSKLQNPVSFMADQGKAILRYQGQLIEGICKTAREATVGLHKVLCANSSCLFSEVAEFLARDRPLGACWFVRSDGQIQYSLRSREGGVDVSEVARLYGGGGHKDAAGFEVEPSFSIPQDFT